MSRPRARSRRVAKRRDEILTPLVDEWIEDHGEGAVELLDLIDELHARTTGELT